VILALSGVTHAHSSVDEVAADIQKTERYMELVDREPPPFILSDTDGNRVTLADFAGKVVILNFVYARCRDVCPLHSALLAKVQRQLREVGLVEGIQFVSIATDTEEVPATVERMRQHGTQHGLDPTNWIFLHRGMQSPADTTVRLAERYGLQFTPTPDGVQMHGVVTHVIDPDGRLRARFHGLRFAPQNLVIYAAALVHGGEHSATPKEAANTAGATSASPGVRETAMDTRVRLVMGLLGLVLALLAAYAWHRERRKP
jgi:protein SCO1/2